MATRTKDTQNIEAQETPEKPDLSFPIVGIGASAGGLAAFEAFFSGMPAEIDPGMAFVLVQHLAPDHKSILSDLIRRYTRMAVYEVEDGMRVQPNCAYIIPPARDMAFFDGSLQLLEPSAPRGQRLPIDFFFRSLALDLRERAIGIILSGTGSDGTLGVRAIKGEGGMVMVQSPDSTEYDGMPLNAIATGLVDYQLKPIEMAAKLMAYAGQKFSKHAPINHIPIAQAENALKKIFVLLRAGTGHDFSQYKENTVNRRIERRMAVHQLEKIDHYIKYLQQTPTEIEALFRDLLIGVTNFFRDTEAFLALEQKVIPMLFSGKPAGTTIRIWVTGCSTGEEAYSIAILLQEYMESMKQSYLVQIFASDIDSNAIATARAGIYPGSIATDISAERLARFFSVEPDGTYRIQKNIRDMLVFSEHNITKDPPFSKVDLISCRNLLIYLGGDLQRRVISLFHYALNPKGMLFLGTSETVGDVEHLFTTLDRKSKIFRRGDDSHEYPRPGLGSFLSPMATMNKYNTHVDSKTLTPAKLPLREMTEKAILTQVAPVAVLVNRQGDILYLHGRTGLYLELPPGEAATNIFKMAREGLELALTPALQKAVLENKIVRSLGVLVKTNGNFTGVNLTVHPVVSESADSQDAQLYLVVFEQASTFDPGSLQNVAVTDNTADFETSDISVEVITEAGIKKLKQELRIKEEYLQSTIEELDTSNEELKSSNEEMQSINEELQSTNEELETSKEELQSVNEELATVNAELQTKVADLSQANNDMNNLLAGTGLATIFVDHQQHILRFTPTASQIINLIQVDIGRPVGHIVSNLRNYNSLVEDVQRVLDTLVPKETDVQTLKDQWYRMRIQPYRTLNNVIEGAVITFSNITEAKVGQESLAKAQALNRLAIVVRDTSDCMTVQDLSGAILAWNPSATKMYGWSEAEALTMNARDFIPKELREEALNKIQKLSQAEILESYRTKRICKDSTVIPVRIISTALVDETGKMYAIATTERKDKIIL